MGLKGQALLVGAAQYKPEKICHRAQMFHLEQVADLATQALDDAGLALSDVDGLITVGPQFHEAGMFVLAMAGEYLGVRLNLSRWWIWAVPAGGHGLRLPPLRAGHVRHRGVRDSLRMAPTAPNDDHMAEVMKACATAATARALARPRPRWICPTATWRKTPATP